MGQPGRLGYAARTLWACIAFFPSFARRPGVRSCLLAFTLSACGGRAEFDATSLVGKWRLLETVCNGQQFRTGLSVWLDVEVDTMTVHEQSPDCEIAAQFSIDLDHSTLRGDVSTSVFSCNPPQCDAMAWATLGDNRASVVSHCPVTPPPAGHISYELRADQLVQTSNDGTCSNRYVKE